MDSEIAFSPEILQAIINRYQKIRKDIPSYEKLHEAGKLAGKVNKEGWRIRSSSEANLLDKKAQLKGAPDKGPQIESEIEKADKERLFQKQRHTTPIQSILERKVGAELKKDFDPKDDYSKAENKIEKEIKDAKTRKERKIDYLDALKRRMRTS
jgi:hypothetical protein